MSTITQVDVEVPKDQKENNVVKLDSCLFPHKISSIIYLLLSIGTTFLFVHITLQMEHIKDILTYFLEYSTIVNFYLIIIPVVVTSITILIFCVINPERSFDFANFQPFFKIMTYGCRELLLSTIIMVIVPFVIIYIALCAHWTLLYEILADTKGDLYQNVTTVEEYEMYIIIVIETLMFLYIPKMTIMIIAQVHHRKLDCMRNEKNFNGVVENFKAIVDVCVFKQGLALISSVLMPYYGIKNMCLCKGTAVIDDKSLIQATIYKVELKKGAEIVTKKVETLDQNIFKNVDLFMLLLAIFNTIDSTILYVLFVTMDPLFVTFELIIALEIANKLLFFCSTISYVKILNE